jgi:hypothetical protein
MCPYFTLKDDILLDTLLSCIFRFEQRYMEAREEMVDTRANKASMRESCKRRKNKLLYSKREAWK